MGCVEELRSNGARLNKVAASLRQGSPLDAVSLGLRSHTTLTSQANPTFSRVLIKG